MGKRKTGNPQRAASANPEEELHAAARTGDLNAVQKICSINPLAINSRDRHSRTPLHLAAWSGHAHIVDYLCKNKADAGASAMDDMGAIHFAAQKGHLEVVRSLVASGVSVKSLNRKGMTALHYAAQGSHLELLKYLLKKGANVDAKNKAGKTPLDLASNDEIRSCLAERRSTSNGLVSDNKEKEEGAIQITPSEQKATEHNGDVSVDGDVETCNETDTSAKSKGVDDSNGENAPEPKKAKVSLNHLLAVDDAGEDQENQ